MSLSGLSESGYLSNALLTESMSASVSILVYMESVSRVPKSASLGFYLFLIITYKISVFLKNLSRLFAIGFKYSDIMCDSDPQSEMYVYMYVCLFVCVCMHAYMYLSMYIRMYVFLVCIYVCMYVCMYGCVCV